MHPGCGIQLAYKIINDSEIFAGRKPELKTKAKIKQEQIQPPVYVSPATALHFLESEKFTKLSDPTAAQPGSIVIIDDKTASANVSSLMQAKNIICVCVNVSGEQRIATQMGIDGWSATASIAFYDDFIAKLKKAATLTGRRYIEVLTPCPRPWKTEPANTVEIARQAVETGFWPLFEIDSGKFTLSYKPVKLANTDAFVGLQKLIAPDRAQLEKSWRLVTLGKIFESRA